jgi:hypothetical protein
MPPHLKSAKMPLERKARLYVAEQLQLDTRAGWGIEDAVFTKLAVELMLRGIGKGTDLRRREGSANSGRS